MKSFRSEIENPLVQTDIIELEKKIAAFKLGEVDEEKFRSLRLARGVYGQRQPGVQMVRIKIPFGYLNGQKLRRICDVADTYSTGRLHVTTRQDIQIHHVQLDRTPELWAELEKDEITLREACGNTVRNITCSELSGIDPDEAFDPRPYADAVFKYFLRNPICQEMGRKFKISFSNSKKDTALAFMHDLGFIAKTKTVKGETIKGFSVWIGGGLGSQSVHAHQYSEFMRTENIIPFIEATLRVFERYGERSRRMKARLKFLIKSLGYEEFIKLVEEELASIEGIITIEDRWLEPDLPDSISNLQDETLFKDAFRLWSNENLISQKDGRYAIGVKLRLGDLYTDQARKLSEWIQELSGNEITLTVNQNLIIRHVDATTLTTWFSLLNSIGLSDAGFNSLSDITACPGTDTCNLGIASSTGLAKILESIITEEYPQFRYREDLNIKISGCMNSCGQHMISAIGFQGMSIKAPDKRVLPAAQVLLGGGVLGNGYGRFGDKVIKVPSKRVPEVTRTILNDYIEYDGSANFHDYYDARGTGYFYDLLKPLAQTDNLSDDEFLDWGHTAPYVKAIGIGECAGVVIDLVSTLLFESEEKIQLAQRTLDKGQFKDSIYHSYAAFLNTAKALLLSENHKTNSHFVIINDFQSHFVDTNKIILDKEFTELVLEFKRSVMTEELASDYLKSAIQFYRQADKFRLKTLQHEIEQS